MVSVLVGSCVETIVAGVPFSFFLSNPEEMEVVNVDERELDTVFNPEEVVFDGVDTRGLLVIVDLVPLGVSPIVKM